MLEPRIWSYKNDEKDNHGPALTGPCSLEEVQTYKKAFVVSMVSVNLGRNSKLIDHRRGTAVQERSGKTYWRNIHKGMLEEWKGIKASEGGWDFEQKITRENDQNIKTVCAKD